MSEDERYKDLESLFRQKLEGAEIEPGGNLTGRFMSRLERREFFRFNPARFNLYYLTAAAAALLAAGILIFSRADEGREKPVTGNPATSADTRVREADPPATASVNTDAKGIIALKYSPATTSDEENRSTGGMPSPERSSSVIISPRQEAVSLKIASQAVKTDATLSITDAKAPPSETASSADAWPEPGESFVTSETVTSEEDELFLRFPNAFIPYTGGPTGGYYNQRIDEANQVFHPVSSGVTAFNLKIFSKQGLMVFESNDLAIGWDGYYRGQLCSPGVYIWKAGGLWRNGQPIVLSGDITLLKY